MFRRSHDYYSTKEKKKNQFDLVPLTLYDLELMEEADTPVDDNSTEDTASSSKGKGKRKASPKTRAAKKLNLENDIEMH
jgi:hypothetical protein